MTTPASNEDCTLTSFAWDASDKWNSLALYLYLYNWKERRDELLMGIDLRGSYLFWSVFGKLTSRSCRRLLGASARNFSFPRDIFMTCLPEIMCARIVNEMSLWKWRCRISSTASIAASQPPARDKASVFVVCVRQRNPVPSTTTTDWLRGISRKFIGS